MEIGKINPNTSGKINVPFKKSNDKYYEYGSQKYLKEQRVKEYNYVKASLVVAFGMACLAVGVFTKPKIL